MGGIVGRLVHRLFVQPGGEEAVAFKTPFEQELDPNNRWVKVEVVVPWDDRAKVFFASMSADQGGASVDLRVVLGAPFRPRRPHR